MALLVWGRWVRYYSKLGDICLFDVDFGMMLIVVVVV